MTAPIGQQEAAEAFQAYLGSRFHRLDRFERYVSQTQYDGRPDFFSDDTPLLRRAPCIVLGLTQEAIRSHASMVCGEGRFPRLTTHGDEDDTDLDDRFGLSKEDSAAIDPFLAKVAKGAKLQTVGRRSLDWALSCGTTVTIACVRKGRLAVDTVRAKFCTPRLDPSDPSVVQSLEIRFPYLVEERTAGGQTQVRAKLYRRVIDAQRDVTYVPADALQSGAEPTWIPAEGQTFEHGFGFCPVHWYKCMADDLGPADIDGHPLHETLLDELYSLDLARSQIHRAALTTLDPIMAEIGVDPGFSPTPLVDLVKSMDGLFVGNPTDPARQIWGDPTKMRGGGGIGKGRKRAPGMAYQYPMGADVKLLTLPGDALEAGFRNASTLEEHICDLLRWRPMDPKTMQSSALSGRALEWLHKKQIDFDNELRTDFADNWLLPVVNMLLRVALHLSKGKARASVFVHGLARVAPILSRFEVEQEGGVRMWISPTVDCQWPPYFPPNEQDAFVLGKTVREDLKAGVITKRTAVEKMAPFYGISDVDQYVLGLEAPTSDTETSTEEEPESVSQSSSLLPSPDGERA